MNILATNQPIVKMSYERLGRMKTLTHYALVGLYEELREKGDEEVRDMIDLKLEINKYEMLLKHINNLLAN